MCENETNKLMEHLKKVKASTRIIKKVYRTLSKNSGVNVSNDKNKYKEEQELYKLFLMLIDLETSMELKIRKIFIDRLKTSIEEETGWIFYENEIKFEQNNVDTNNSGSCTNDTYLILYNETGYYVPEPSQLNNLNAQKIYDDSMEFLNYNKEELDTICDSQNKIKNIMNGNYELSEFGKKLCDPEIPILIAQRLGYDGIAQNHQKKNKIDNVKIKKIK